MQYKLAPRWHVNLLLILPAAWAVGSRAAPRHRAGGLDTCCVQSAVRAYRKSWRMLWLELLAMLSA